MSEQYKIFISIEVGIIVGLLFVWLCLFLYYRNEDKKQAERYRNALRYEEFISPLMCEESPLYRLIK
jgi:sensor c-di-GMP phosphodiesterase-like protein